MIPPSSRFSSYRSPCGATPQLWFAFHSRVIDDVTVLESNGDLIMGGWNILVG
jgi:hypothetical protein